MLYLQNHIQDVRNCWCGAPFHFDECTYLPDVQAHLPLVLVGDLEGLLETPGETWDPEIGQIEIAFVKFWWSDWTSTEISRYIYNIYIYINGISPLKICYDILFIWIIKPLPIKSARYPARNDKNWWLVSRYSMIFLLQKIIQD